MNPHPDGTAAAEILAQIRQFGPPSLGPGVAKNGPWKKKLLSLSDQELLGLSSVKDTAAAAAVRSGLLLMADDLNASHTISQGIATEEGSFWHGIMHRREPDYSNSKYWFRRVGGHAVFEELYATVDTQNRAAAEITTAGPWDPLRMVDLVEASESQRRPELTEELVALQELEMLLLLAHCQRKAAGG